LAHCPLHGAGQTCAEVQDAVQSDCIAILYRKAFAAGVPIYDRYVASQSFCQPGQATIKETVPTADPKSCRVSKCKNRFGGSNR